MDNETKDILRSIRTATWLLAVSVVVGVAVFLLKEIWVFLLAILPASGTMRNILVGLLSLGGLIVLGFVVAYVAKGLITRKTGSAPHDGSKLTEE
jgi:hypothetical protein